MGQFGNGYFAMKKLEAPKATIEIAYETNNGEHGQVETTSHGLLPLIQQDFEAEVDCLRRFTGGSHDHLVSLLTAFQKGSDYYFLFHWAESDLGHYWSTSEPGSALKKSNLLWMIEQFIGIADGLRYIHHYRDSMNDGTLGTSTMAVPGSSIFGRHGDIKPENLLVFKRKDLVDSRGTIQLSDFGLARFHSELSRSGVRPSRLDGCSPTYRPPEVEFKEAKVSRAYDIWSLACVLLEFITWYLGGNKELQHFVNQRKRPDLHGHSSDQFFEIAEAKNSAGKEVLCARVKQEVSKVPPHLDTHSF